MAIVLRKVKKDARKPKARDDVPAAVLGSVVMLAFCAMVADGEVADEELEGLREIVISGFDRLLGKQISDEEADAVIDRAGAAFEELGYEGMMNNAVAVVSPVDELKTVALTFVALVSMSDGEAELDGAESQYFDDLAVMLGVDEEAAAAIWNETMESFE